MFTMRMRMRKEKVPIVHQHHLLAILFDTQSCHLALTLKIFILIGLLLF